MGEYRRTRGKRKSKKKKNKKGNCLGERDGVVLSGDGWTRHETGTALGSKRCGLMGMHRHSHALSEMDCDVELKLATSLHTLRPGQSVKRPSHFAQRI